MNSAFGNRYFILAVFLYNKYSKGIFKKHTQMYPKKIPQKRFVFGINEPFSDFQPVSYYKIRIVSFLGKLLLLLNFFLYLVKINYL